MVDPNPARGMPLPLQRYWLAGKGAAKIRWRMPHDFTRCVRQLRKHFPANPEGLCNILHQKAVGAPPGKGHPGTHSIEEYVFTSGFQVVDRDALVAAQELIDRQPRLGDVWAGPIATIGRPTEEPRRKRVFEPGALRHRALPLALAWREIDAPGHEGAVTIGRILGITYGPDDRGDEYAWGWGDYLDDTIIPETRKARHLVEKGVVGASVDPGGEIQVRVDPEAGTEYLMKFTIGRATLVPIPAYSATRLYSFTEGADWPDDDPDMVMELEDGGSDCGCGDVHTAALDTDQTFAVNPSGWRGLPLAPRDAVFDNDDAVKRIAAWANVNAEGADIDKLRRAFLWYNPEQPPTMTTSYRLPVGDIINGQLTLIYHAIYAAAALMSGAHGGLPGISEADRSQIRNAISDIYPAMAEEFNDSSIRAPWDRSAAEGVQLSMDHEEETFAMNESHYPVEPPGAWFQNPNLSGKTPLTVTPDGHVYGHIAAWGECHRDFAGRECVLAPKSKQSYGPFHLGTVVTAEGDTLRAGKIVMDTRHADIGLGYTAAAIHYDNTGDEVAVVRAGEDEYGIWVAGAVVPEATPAKAAKLRRSPISGDWRRVDGNLELTAALAVNVPAFPVYSMEDDQVNALTAAGTLEPIMEPPNGIVPFPDSDVFAAEVAAKVLDRIKEAEENEYRLGRLRDLQEDDEIYAQREREMRFTALVAAVQPPAPGPVPPQVAAPVPAVPGQEVPEGQDGVWPPDDDTLLAMQMDARFSIVKRPDGETQSTGADQGPPAGTKAPAPPVRGPAQPAPPQG